MRNPHPDIPLAPLAPEVREILRSDNRYRTRNWDREVATRYVFGFGTKIAEASFFAHFSGPRHVKNAIELPTSYGCPIGCRHCAATLLQNSQPLSDSEVVGMVEWITKEHMISRTDPFLATFSGIGEGALHRQSLASASRWIHRAFEKARFTFTTVGYDPSFVDFVNELAGELPTHFLQVSYLHHDTQALARVIPAAERLGFDFANLLQAIRRSDNIRIRLNYVVVRDYNDDPDHLNQLMKRLVGFEGKVVLRVARLNQTATSGLSDFCEPEVGRLEEIVRDFTNNGFEAYLFASSRNDHLNCGQLAGRYGDRTLRAG